MIDDGGGVARLVGGRRALALEFLAAAIVGSMPELGQFLNAGPSGPVPLNKLPGALTTTSIVIKDTAAIEYRRGRRAHRLPDGRRGRSLAHRRDSDCRRALDVAAERLLAA